MQPLTKRELDRATIAGCQVPGCTHDDHSVLFLNGRCHGTKIEASYKIGSGIVKIACRVCKRPIVDIAVEGLLGATGDAPISANPNDKGGVNAALSIEGELVKLEFGTSLSFMLMTKEQANTLAAVLFDFALKLPGE